MVLSSNMKKVSEEVYYGKELIVPVDMDTVDELKRLALMNERRRVRLCAHGGVDDAVHEMIIVHMGNTYVRPHKHVGKSESFHIIEGLATLVLFGETGRVAQLFRLGDSKSARSIFFRIGEPLYHTLLIQSEFFVFHETTCGPFDRSKTLFPSWAPEEGEIEKISRFMKRLAREIESFGKRE